MKTTAHTAIQEKKPKAVEITQRLDIYKPYIEYFRKKDRFLFENFGGFRLYQEPETDRKRQEIEAKHNLSYLCSHARIYRLRRVLRFPRRHELSRRMRQSRRCEPP